MKKKNVVLISIVLIVIIVAVAVYCSYRGGESDYLILSGNLEITEINLGFTVPGKIGKILVDEGDRVKEGDILASLDTTESERAVIQAKAASDEAMARLTELKAGPRSQELEQARANVRSQEAELMRVKKDYERAEVLYKNGAISASQFDAAKSAYDARSALHRAAFETLSLVSEGARRESIEAAAHRLEQSKASLGIAEKRLKDATITAPVHGIILRKNGETGEIVPQSTPVFTLGNLDEPWVKVYVKEDMLAHVKVGQKAAVTVDSFKNKTYNGTVAYISSEAEFTPKTVQTREERVKLVFGVKVRVKNENGELKPGMPADVRLRITQD